MFLPMNLGFSMSFSVIAHLRGGEPADTLAGIRRIVAELDPLVPVTGAQTLDEHVSHSTDQPRAFALLASVFGGLALLLAVIGVYGTLSFLVRGRTREIGVRVAVGARPVQVLLLIVRRAGVLVAVGLALGGVGAALVSRGIESMLYGTTRIDATTAIVVASVLAAAVLLVSLMPVRRALRLTSFAYFVKTEGVQRLIAVGVVMLLAALSLRAQAPPPVTPLSATTPPATTPPASVQPAPLPPPADGPVDFTRDIRPILQTSCVRCHARGKQRGGFSMETREALMEGGDTGAAIVPGKSADSLLISLVAGLDPDLVMPQKGSRLKPAQIGLLRAWIDQGAQWDPTVTFARTAPKNLNPRKVTLPPVAAAASATHPVDRLLAPYFASHKVTPGSRADDRVLARRLYLDVLGVPPTPDEMQVFLTDRRPNKRALLIDTLLADRHRYAAHWISFWNDLLRNDYRGPGYIDGGRRQITAWLYAALANNLPYDEFVAQLVNPARGAEGFAKGIVWRGVVNASQTPPLQAAQNISQVFMGVNLKCASCHDSFINDWQLSDAYGLAGIYADAPLEMVECDRPTGKTAPTKFLYTELGTIDGNAPRAERLAQLAQVITGPKNGRLPRTVVNRLWARFMGRGLVEPVDDMDQAAFYPDLLDWLAEDLVAHNYDLKHTMRRILTSRAYQSVAVDVPERVDAFVFRGPAIRRLSAEQFVDALSAITGVWQEKPIGDFDYIAAGTADAHGIAEHTRASFVTADPLMVALGRPNREQVLTTRAAAATTLQALELQNGATLAKWLGRGAEHLLKEQPNTPDALIARVYQRALGRAPTPAEAAIGRELLGETAKREGVEDLLWTLAMLPEFQLIY